MKFSKLLENQRQWNVANEPHSQTSEQIMLELLDAVGGVSRAAVTRYRSKFVVQSKLMEKEAVSTKMGCLLGILLKSLVTFPDAVHPAYKNCSDYWPGWALVEDEILNKSTFAELLALIIEAGLDENYAKTFPLLFKAAEFFDLGKDDISKAYLKEFQVP